MNSSLRRIIVSDIIDEHDKVYAIFHLLQQVLEDITENDRIVFTTLFARISFVGQRYNIPSQDLFLLQTFRRSCEKKIISTAEVNEYIALGEYLIRLLLHYFSDQLLPEKAFDISLFKPVNTEVESYHFFISAYVIDIDIASKTMTFFDDADGSKLLLAKWDVVDKNEQFTDSITKVSKHIELPCEANLLDVEILNDGVYVPKAFVFQPNYLMDVTSIARSFQSYGSEAVLSLVSMFKADELRSLALLVGNIANLLLDELVSNPDASFSVLIPKIFQLEPIAFSLLDDKQVKDVVSKAKLHYENLKSAIKKEFTQVNIDIQKVYLEPSFYSRIYGLQGRLDLFHNDTDIDKKDIVELKSGSTYKTNRYGLNNDHYIQTLLYDLLIKSTFGHKSKPANYILYSKESSRRLRYAPATKIQQYEALNVRNELVVLENIVAFKSDVFRRILKYLKSDNFDQVKGFVLNDLKAFSKSLDVLSEEFYAYLVEFAAFLKREQFLSKTGVHGIENSNGQASLWLEGEQEKEERFSLLKQLTITENASFESVPMLTLSHTKASSSLAKFRVGDIVVLYPYKKGEYAVLRDQIFKCAIVQLLDKTVTVKLRSRQFNQAIFDQYTHWNIEEDMLDSSFSKGYRSLYNAVTSKKSKKSLLLGLTKPSVVEKGIDVSKYTSLTEEQRYILSSMLVAEDYYLLWGPPGTGKTSVMIKTYVQHIMEETDENILLMAYTNRAVDEICDAVSSIAEEYREAFIRVGSTTSCAPAHKNRILDKVIEHKTNRNEVKEVLQSARIYIATVSSILNKPELFTFIEFGSTVIDEASQILEPTIVGLLSKLGKFIMVGDHKQMPAIVQQQKSLRTIQSEALRNIGITDMSMSMFERMYRQCIRYEWTHAYGQLTFQGRMQQELMEFPNVAFYEDRLKPIDSLKRLSRQRWTRLVGQKTVPQARRVFVESDVSDEINYKTNLEEAQKVATLLRQYVKIYGEDLTPNAIGVITPYRAQIALIIHECTALDIDLTNITVDTVERYQGGARELIILSMCVNTPRQFKSLMSLSEEGVDRKLNVALTRAKEQIIIVGNRATLETQPLYKQLLDSYTTWELVNT